MKKISVILTSLLLLSHLAFAQDDYMPATAASGFADEEFRRGVQSYYRGAFSESIMEFERALNYVPGDSRILDWLGKAYYKAGIEGAALQAWQSASDAGWGGILLQKSANISGKTIFFYKRGRLFAEEYDTITLENKILNTYMNQNTTEKGIKLIRRYYGIIGKK